MPSLKDLKIRINSVKSTRKITKAMQMVAAAKLRRAQEAAEAGRPYAERMTGVLSNLASSTRDSPNAPLLLAGTGKEESHLLVVATAERGLCGGFNSSIVRLAREHIRKLQAEGKTVRILCIGRKGREQLRREYGSLFVTGDDGKTYSVEITGRNVSYKDAQGVADTVLGRFESGEFDVVTLFFSRFRSVIEQVPTALRLIPAEVPEEAGGAGGNYEYEPDETAILNDLLPRNVAVQIFAGLLENAASEQGARMSAMDNATRNAGEMVDKLTLQYNRSRQAAITKELIEIISGAEAL